MSWQHLYQPCVVGTVSCFSLSLSPTEANPAAGLLWSCWKVVGQSHLHPSGAKFLSSTAGPYLTSRQIDSTSLRFSENRSPAGPVAREARWGPWSESAPRPWPHLSSFRFPRPPPLQVTQLPCAGNGATGAQQWCARRAGPPGGPAPGAMEAAGLAELCAVRLGRASPGAHLAWCRASNLLAAALQPQAAPGLAISISDPAVPQVRRACWPLPVPPLGT